MIRRRTVGRPVGLIRVLAVGALAVSVAVVAVGCTPAPAPSPSPVTATAAPTRAPQPTTPPATGPGTATASATVTPGPSDGGAETSAPIDLADPASWVVTFEGIGPMRLGRSMTETAADLSALEQLPSTPGCPVSSFSAPGELGGVGIVAAADDESVVGEAFFTGPADPAMASQAPSTAEGVGPGSSESAVQAAYPDAPHSAPDSNDTSDYLLTDGNGRYIHFDVFQATVIQVTLTGSADRPHTSCA